MTVEKLQQGYLKIYKDIYSFKNIIKRTPKAKSQWIPYYLFNTFYRKYGKFTDLVCRIIGYKRVGKITAFLSYNTK